MNLRRRPVCVCAVLRNRIMGCTYSWLRPERRVLDRRIEISRTLYFYVCFFGRGQRDLSLFGVGVVVVLVLLLLFRLLIVLNSECVKSISIFWDLSGFFIDYLFF